MKQITRVKNPHITKNLSPNKKKKPANALNKSRENTVQLQPRKKS